METEQILGFGLMLIGAICGGSFGLPSKYAKPGTPWEVLWGPFFFFVAAASAPAAFLARFFGAAVGFRPTAFRAEGDFGGGSDFDASLAFSALVGRFGSRPLASGAISMSGSQVRPPSRLRRQWPPPGD